MLGELLHALTDVGLQIYHDAQSGDLAKWKPLIEILGPGLKSKLYHEEREAQLHLKLQDLRVGADGDLL